MCVKNCGVISNILLTKNTNFLPSKSALYGTLVYFRPCEMAGDTRTCLCWQWSPGGWRSYGRISCHPPFIAISYLTMIVLFMLHCVLFEQDTCTRVSCIICSVSTTFVCFGCTWQFNYFVHVIDVKSQCHRTKPLMCSWRYISWKYKWTRDFNNQYLFVHKLWINSNKRIQHQHRIYTCKEMSSFAKVSIKFLRWNYRNTHWISALFGGITFHNDWVGSLNHPLKEALW